MLSIASESERFRLKTVIPFLNSFKKINPIKKSTTNDIVYLFICKIGDCVMTAYREIDFKR